MMYVAVSQGQNGNCWRVGAPYKEYVISCERTQAGQDEARREAVRRYVEEFKVHADSVVVRGVF